MNKFIETGLRKEALFKSKAAIRAARKNKQTRKLIIDASKGLRENLRNAGLDGADLAEYLSANGGELIGQLSKNMRRQARLNTVRNIGQDVISYPAHQARVVKRKFKKLADWFRKPRKKAQVPPVATDVEIVDLPPARVINTPGGVSPIPRSKNAHTARPLISDNTDQLVSPTPGVAVPSAYQGTNPELIEVVDPTIGGRFSGLYGMYKRSRLSELRRALKLNAMRGGRFVKNHPKAALAGAGLTGYSLGKNLSNNYDDGYSEEDGGDDSAAHFYNLASDAAANTRPNSFY